MCHSSPKIEFSARFRNPPQCPAKSAVVKMQGSWWKCNPIGASTHLTAANSAQISPQNPQSGSPEILSGICNALPEFTAQDTRKTIRISPLGEFPIIIGGRRVIQVVDRTAVNMMREHFSMPVEKLRQIFTNLRQSWHPGTGLSIYEGHIDDPAYVNTYNVSNQDNRAVARIKALSSSPDTGELLGSVVVNQYGRELMAGEAPAYGFHSPLWTLVEAPDRGPNYMRPAILLSCALTNTPNIPDNTIALNTRKNSESSPSNSQPPMTPELLTALGLAADATPEQALAAANALYTRADTAEQALATAKTEAANSATTLATITTERDTAVTAANAARSNIITLHLDTAIAAGKLKPAHRLAWQTKADDAPDLQTACNALAPLATATPVVKLADASHTKDLPKDISNTTERVQDQINAGVNTIIRETGTDRDSAFRLAETDPRFAKLFTPQP